MQLNSQNNNANEGGKESAKPSELGLTIRKTAKNGFSVTEDHRARDDDDLCVNYPCALDEVYSEDGFSIFCGNARSAANTKLLQDHNIKSVLNVSEQIRFRRVPEGTQKILYYYYPLSDYGETILSEVIEECLLPIDEAREHKFNILVHCKGGVNRSPTVVIAYLMTRMHWSLKKAFDYVHERRPVMSPHELYIRQLITLEELLFHTTTMSFEEYSQSSLQAQLRNIRAQLEKTEVQQENIDTNKQEPIEGPDELCIRSKDNNTDICVN